MIFCVEDDNSIRDLMIYTLNSAGFQAKGFAEGESFFQALKEQKPDFENMEYMDIVSYFNKETNEVLNYLYGMAEKGPSFVTKNNTTFNSIAGKVYQFKETQIEQNLRSLILQHGIVRNQDSYIDRLSYQNINTVPCWQCQADFLLCPQAAVSHQVLCSQNRNYLSSPERWS